MRNFDRSSTFNKKSSYESRGESRRDGPRSFNKGRDSRGGDSPNYRGRDAGRFGRNDPDHPFEKRMHLVTCEKCGERCQVPFKPTGDKPVYCSICFRKEGSSESRGSSTGGSSIDLKEINKKLDKIMEALDIK